MTIIAAALRTVEAATWEEAADISEKLYGLFGKQHPKRQCGETLAKEFRCRSRAAQGGGK